MNLKDLTIDSFHQGLKEKKFSATEITRAYLEEIKSQDKEIGAYLALRENSALEEASFVDEKIANKEEIDTLSGVPIALKDNMLIKGSVTTAGSKILETHIASYDAGVVTRLKNKHAVLLGKTNLDEFAMGSSTENSAFQKTKNPHDLERVPGGSSGGSAAAVAANMALGALGSDTGGSIREPAAFSGVVGMKPTYGTVSRSGLIAMASSLDQIGPFTKTVKDAALMYEGIRGHDSLDATSIKREYNDKPSEPDFSQIKDLTIGLPEEYFVGGLEKEVEMGLAETIKFYENAGFKIKKISLPHTRYALSCYYVIMPAEVSSNLSRLDGIRYARVPDAAKADRLLDIYLKDRGAGFGTEAKRRIILGAFVLSSGYYDAYYGKAQAVRSLITQDFTRAFDEVDVILSPVTPGPAFKLGEKTDDPLAMYLSDIFTIPVNLAGLPAISIPIKNAPKLPIGFQLIGKPFREADILGLGQYYEAY